MAKQKIRLQQKYKDMLLADPQKTLKLAMHFNVREQSILKLINCDSPKLTQHNYGVEIRKVLKINPTTNISEEYTK